MWNLLEGDWINVLSHSTRANQYQSLAKARREQDELMNLFHREKLLVPFSEPKCRPVLIEQSLLQHPHKSFCGRHRLKASSHLSQLNPAQRPASFSIKISDWSGCILTGWNDPDRRFARWICYQSDGLIADPASILCYKWGWKLKEKKNLKICIVKAEPSSFSYLTLLNTSHLSNDTFRCFCLRNE